MLLPLLFGKLSKRTESTSFKVIYSSLNTCNCLLKILRFPVQHFAQQISRNDRNISPLSGRFF